MKPDDLVETADLIAVVGMSCRVPGADTSDEFWQLLRDGVDPVEEVADGHRVESTNGATFVPKRKRFSDPALFDAGFFGLSPVEAAATDPQHRLLLEGSVRALEDAAIDASRFAGDIALYVGMNHSDYLINHVLPDGTSSRALGWHRVLMGNDRGFAATQVSYRLGLTGPSMAVDCACSSGLVAVHQACRALLAFDADAAVAGGINVRPEDEGYLYAEGGIASPDGLCRPFSAQSSGTVFASGAVLFVLRRLEDALADGDRVLAVIRASGINNDGPRKSSFTAPSVEGQAALVRRVHALAGIDPDAVTYVEAHGTGTALGDPIEVAALEQAFGATSGDAGRCLIGSVKSNIGHLDSASGAAGLAKVVLALQHGYLPATLYAEETNPAIDFETSRFQVCSEGRQWDGADRLAAVSSFGVGGTNAHVVLAPAPVTSVATAATPVPETVMLPFSARTTVALDEVEQQLRELLARSEGATVVDTAHTLRRSRLAHPQRRALVWQAGTGTVESVAPARSGRQVVAVLGTLAGGTSDDNALLSDTLGALAIAGSWKEHGVACHAVVAGPTTGVAAAFLSGCLTDEDLTRVVEQVRAGDPEPLRGVVLAPATIPWFDASGDQVCAPGQVPSQTSVLSSRALLRGQRTLSPVVHAVLEIGAVDAVLEGTVQRLFPTAARLFDPEAASSAGVGGAIPDRLLVEAWVLGILDDIGADPHGGAVVPVPGHPFERSRHWIERPAAHANDLPVAARSEQHSQAPRPNPPELARQAFIAVLGDREIGVDESLFDLGGDSLLALRIVGIARQLSGASLKAGTFMAAPTVRELARQISEVHPAEGVDDATSAEIDEPLPLGPLQRRFHFLSQVTGATQAYAVPALVDLRGELDVAALADAVNDVVNRHDSLRTAIEETATGPVQRVMPVVDRVELPVIEVRDEKEVPEYVAAALAEDLPLTRTPPMSARLLRIGSNHHVFVGVLHHIVADARSTSLFLRDMFHAYERRTSGDSAELPDVSGLFRAHLQAERRWLDSAEATEQRQYWTGALAGAPESLELPRTARVTEHEGSRRSFSVPAVVPELRALAEAADATVFSVVLSVFALVLGRTAGTRDLVFGVPVSGRDKPGTADLIGNFVNTLPLRVTIDDDESLRDMVARVARQQRAALDHQDIPLEELAAALGRGGPGTPLVPVLFNLLEGVEARPEGPAGLVAHPVPFTSGRSPVELQLDWWLTANGDLGGRFLHQTSLDSRDVALWTQSFRAAVRDAIRHPDSAVGDLQVEPASAAAWVRRVLAGPSVDVVDIPVHEVFFARAESHPSDVAVTDGVHRWDYGELAARALTVSARLRRAGVAPGDPVAIVMRRGAPLVAALIGVLAAGGTAVPLDLEQPTARLGEVLRHSGARVACVDAEGASLTDGMAAVHVTSEPDGEDPGDGSTKRWRAQVARTMGAYLTYTSGTTGTPKGIEFPHGALADLIAWDTEGFSVSRRVLQFASYGFDAAYHETFSALCAGGSLHIASDQAKHDHDLLLDLLSTEQIEKMIVSVSVLHALAARSSADRAGLATMRELQSTGEQLHVTPQIARLVDEIPGCTLVNNYGPAETHVVTSYRFSGPSDDWPPHAPIGRPIPNVTLRLVDDHGRDVPRGSIGDLLITGHCVANGYRGQPELTATRFSGDLPGERSYRTGDRCRLTADGDLVLLGRADRQVKVRGQRVELAEVEDALRDLPGVREVAVVTTGTAGDIRLHGFVTTTMPDGPGPGALARGLRAVVPHYMVPGNISVLPRFPVNNNGKVDLTDLTRLALGEDGNGWLTRQAAVEAPEETDKELATLTQLFREVLDRTEVDADSNFFEYGGHSLLATTLAYRIRTDLGVRLGMEELLAAATPRRMRDLLESRAPESAGMSGIVLPEARLPVPLPPSMRWLAGEPAETHQKSWVFAVHGELDTTRLAKAVDVVARSQRALSVRLLVEDEVPWLVESHDGEGTTSVVEVPVDGPDGLRQWLGTHPVDWRTEAPARLVLGRSGVGSTWLGLTLHRGILDGRSVGNLLTMLRSAYTAPVKGAVVDDGFLRYLGWRSAAVRDAMPELPRQVLLSSSDDVVDSIGDHAPQLVAAWSPDVRLQQALTAACVQERCTAFVWHLAAAVTAIARATQSSRVELVVPVDGRTGPELASTVGAFANVVPLGFDIAPGRTVREVFEEVRDLVAGLEQWRSIPVSDLVRRTDDGPYEGPPMVFNYIREGTDTTDFGAARLETVGHEPLDPGIRAQLAVVDGQDSFRFSASFRSGDATGDAVLHHFRDALLDLVFDSGRGVSNHPEGVV